MGISNPPPPPPLSSSSWYIHTLHTYTYDFLLEAILIFSRTGMCSTTINPNQPPWVCCVSPPPSPLVRASSRRPLDSTDYKHAMSHLFATGHRPLETVCIARLWPWAAICSHMFFRKHPPCVWSGPFAPVLAVLCGLFYSLSNVYRTLNRRIYTQQYTCYMSELCHSSTNRKWHLPLAGLFPHSDRL
jgi:hypothetical protein